MLWTELADILNSDGSGGKKSVSGWQTSWKDLKKQVKEKCARIRKSMEKTGGGYAAENPLTPWEEKVASLLGDTAIYGLPVNCTGREALLHLDLATDAGCDASSHSQLVVDGAACGGLVSVPGTSASPGGHPQSYRPRKRKTATPLEEIAAATSSIDTLAECNIRTSDALSRQAAAMEEMATCLKKRCPVDERLAAAEERRAVAEERCAVAEERRAAAEERRAAAEEKRVAVEQQKANALSALAIAVTKHVNGAK